jgi:hypothetical protein
MKVSTMPQWNSMIAFIARSSGRGSTQRLRIYRFAERGRLVAPQKTTFPLHGQR